MPQQPTTREVEHEIEVDAPSKSVYQLIADVSNWPSLFPPTVHVEHAEQTGTSERITIWATANGEAKHWTSIRELDQAGLRIDFRQERSTPPVGAMGGAWVIEPLGDDRCRVRLLHDYRAVDDDPGKLAWIDQAVDRNSKAELAALKTNAELVSGSGRLLLEFEDSVTVAGSVKDVYDFVNEARLWQERLPHVARVSMTEDVPGLQILKMDTRAKDGSVHTTESVRVAFPHRSIVYKQTRVPALMTLHTGRWTFEAAGDHVVATSRHTVFLNEENIAAVLGEDATVEDARDYVHKALSTNSLATLGHAKDYAESKR